MSCARIHLPLKGSDPLPKPQLNTDIFQCLHFRERNIPNNPYCTEFVHRSKNSLDKTPIYIKSDARFNKLHVIYGSSDSRAFFYNHTNKIVTDSDKMQSRYA